MSDSRATHASLPELPAGMDALSVGRAAFGTPDLPAPPGVDGFSDISWLGEGGFGRVWRARRDSDGTVTALKIPHQCDAETAELMEQEAGTLKALDHPNIVRLYDVAADATGAPVLVMELVDGPPLTSHLPPHGFDFDHALQIFLPVLDAVAHAHARGIVHRDLKPSNILLAADGTPKVTDFGLAQPLKDQRVAFALTKSGILAGTVEYLAPERYDPNTKAGSPADIYALGVILYELLTGRPPRGAWQPPSQIKRLDVRLDELILDAINADPAKRLPSAEVFRRRLQEIRDTRPRYAGTPLVTRAVRAADFIWTLAGLYFLAAGFCSLLGMNKTKVPGVFDLTFGHSQVLGGFWALWILTVGMGLVWLWQTVRLWKFKRVPVREALPSPFGLRLGRSRGGTVLVALTQFLCAWAPLAYMGWIYSQCWFWIQPDTPVWDRVLAVTRAADYFVAPEAAHLTPVSPWTWDPANFFNAGRYYIRDVQPSVHSPGAFQPHEKQSFFIFTQPLLMALGAFAIGTGVAATVIFGALEWFRRCTGRFVLCFIAAAAAVFGVTETIGFERAQRRDYAGDAGVMYAFFPNERIKKTGLVVRSIFDSINGNGSPLPADVATRFADKVTCFKERGLARSELLRRLEAQRQKAVAERMTTEQVRTEVGADSTGWFARNFQWERYTNSPEGTTSGGYSTLSCRGGVTDDSLTGFIGCWEHETVPLYHAVDRSLNVPEAVEWLDSFLTCLSTEGCPGLENFFLPTILAAEPVQAKFFVPVPAAGVVQALRTSRAAWTTLTLAAAAAPATRSLSGGRRELDCNLLQSGIRRNERPRNERLRWQIEIVFVDGRWQILRLRM